MNKYLLNIIQKVASFSVACGAIGIFDIEKLVASGYNDEDLHTNHRLCYTFEHTVSTPSDIPVLDKPNYNGALSRESIQDLILHPVPVTIRERPDLFFRLTITLLTLLSSSTFSNDPFNVKQSVDYPNLSTACEPLKRKYAGGCDNVNELDLIHSILYPLNGILNKIIQHEQSVVRMLTDPSTPENCAEDIKDLLDIMTLFSRYR